MDQEEIVFSELDEVKTDSSFIQTLARYYSDFLATDFKKERLPKRRFQTRDSKGRRAGIALEKFPSFLPLINKIFSKEFGSNCTIKIKPKTHQIQLPAVVRAAIEGEIKTIDFDELRDRNEKSGKKYQIAISKAEADLETENDKFISDLQLNVGIVIGVHLSNKLEPVFRKSASNWANSLDTVDEDLKYSIVSPMEEALPSVLYKLISDRDEEPLNELLEETFDATRISDLLTDYFSTFSAGDLATELRELHTVEQLADNLEFYIYFGEAKHKNNSFPLFYMPFKLEYNASEASLTFEPRLLINKKAVDYLAQIIQQETGTKRASVVEDRIIYVNPEHTIFDELNNLLEPILRAFQFEGDLAFSVVRNQLSDSGVKVFNSINFALFDKSDESMLTDYEELLQKLGESGGELLGFINNLVNGFLTENPETIKNEIYDEWEDTEVSDRLVFDTPIPLAEEQRKILSALNHNTGRFITVEGPPGTGKSHTISAIAFGAILRGQSVLVLSDKKEALDVVENKLNETLSKVRPSDDFVNPILRLGRVGTNFKKILSNKSIENLRTQLREIRKDRDGRRARYESSVETLKNNIKDRATQAEQISLSEVYDYEKDAEAFRNEYKDFDDFSLIFDSVGDEYAQEISSIKNLLSIREYCLTLSPEIIAFVNNFGEDSQSVAQSLDFINLVKSMARETKIFSDAPNIDLSKLNALNDKISEIKSSKGFFGYLFAGKKITEIKNSINDLIAYTPYASQGDKLILEVQGLLERAEGFYDDLESAFADCAELVPSALKIQLEKPFDGQIIKNLNDLQDIIDSDELLFLGDEESILEILTDPDSAEAAFYDEFISLRETRADIEKKFQLPEYNYAARKLEIENYNALELATQIDARVINFADKYKNDAKTLATIISQKKRFPKDKFDLLKQAFPCMICGLRDYAEYIPLERELFDIIIIDEASQVSIAQAFPAIIRAKKMIILGDRKQFGNVKTANASKELNHSYFAKVKAALEGDRDVIESDLEIRAEKLNISNSILDFMESLSNFDIMLKKHFRGYPEMISFSSKYFYNGALQAMKIRGKPVEEVLQFVELEHDGLADIYKNTNEQEANHILEMVLEQLENKDHRSVAVITPFTEQQTLISKLFADHEKYDEFRNILKFRSFTFDSCQGEERDIIYYSFVATPDKDKLWSILPKELNAQDEEELDRKKKLQRMNVAFSRGKEKLIFVHSKPIADFSAGREALNHYKAQLANAKAAPTEDDVDQSSEAEKRVLEWIQQTQVYTRYQPEIQPQFEIGKYLSMLDDKYNHPMYRVDFLLRFNVDGIVRDVIIEYDGFQFHFDNRSEVDAGNWRQYLTENDVEREHILESYGYETIRLNKFNVGEDPVQTLNDMIEDVLKDFEDQGDALTKDVIVATEKAHEGLLDGTYKICKKCDQNKPKTAFANPSTISGYGRYCNDCVEPRERTTRRKKKHRPKNAGQKHCPNCSKLFPLSEFIDHSNRSGKRRLCSSCKRISDAKREEQTRRYMRSMRRW